MVKIRSFWDFIVPSTTQDDEKERGLRKHNDNLILIQCFFFKKLLEHTVQYLASVINITLCS